MNKEQIVDTNNCLFLLLKDKVKLAKMTYSNNASGRNCETDDGCFFFKRARYFDRQSF